MKWFMKLSMGFFLLSFVLFLFVYMIMPNSGRGTRNSSVQEGTQSATSASAPVEH